MQKKNSPQRAQIQTKLTQFLRKNKILDSQEVGEENIRNLQLTIRRKNYESLSIDYQRKKTESTNFLDDFKREFNLQELRNIWENFRGDTPFNEKDEMILNQLILDHSQHAAILLGEKGLDRLDIRGILREREIRITKYTEEELIKLISGANKKDEIITIERVSYSAKLLNSLILNTKLTTNGNSSFTIITIVRKDEDDGYWPLILRNNTTAVIGILAPFLLD